MSEAEKRRRAAAPTKSLRTFGELTGEAIRLQPSTTLVSN